MKDAKVQNVIIKSLPIILMIAIVIGFILYTRSEDRLRMINDLTLPRMVFSSLLNDQDNIDTSKMIGKRYVLHFFSTWCGYCMQEHENLLRIKNQVPIYGILWKDDSRKALNHLKKDGNPYKNVGIDSHGEISQRLVIEAIPQTLVIDENGQIIFRKKGAFNVNELLKFFPLT